MLQFFQKVDVSALGRFVLRDAVYRFGYPEMRRGKPIRILVSPRGVRAKEMRDKSSLRSLVSGWTRSQRPRPDIFAHFTVLAVTPCGSRYDHDHDHDHGPVPRGVPIAHDLASGVLDAANAVTIRAGLSRDDPDAASGGHGDCRFFRKSCNMI